MPNENNRPQNPAEKRQNDSDRQRQNPQQNPGQADRSSGGRSDKM